MQKKLCKLKSIAFPVAMGFAIVAFVYYIFFVIRTTYTSDYADTLYWTQAMFDSGKLFDPNFEYASLMPLGGQWFYAPFYAIFGFSLTTQMLGQLLFLLVFAGTLLFFARSLNFSWTWSFTTVFCVLGVLSSCEKLREVYFAHIFYYGLGSLFLLLAFGFLLRAENQCGNQKGYTFIILSGLFLLLSSVNGLPFLALVGVPLILAYIIVSVLDYSKEDSKKDTRYRLYLLFFVVVLSLTGFFIGKILTANAKALYQEAFSCFVPSGSWGKNLLSVVDSYFTLFSGEIFEYVPFGSVEGVGALIRLGLGAALAILPVCALFSFPKFKTKGERLTVIVHFLLTAILLFAFVVGGLNNANWRLSPSIVSGTLVSILYLRYLWQSKGLAKRIGLILIAFALIVCLFLLIETIFYPIPDSASADVAVDLSNHMLDTDFTYGYADFWNAGAITTLTNGKVKIRNINQTDFGTLEPYYYQSNSSWFEDQGKDEKYCLILANDQYDILPDFFLNQIVDEEQWDYFHICTLKGPLDFDCK